MKPADVVDISIRFVAGGGWDSKIIEASTHCEWSHVETIWTWSDIVPPYLRHMTFGAQLRGGVKFRELNDPVYKNVKAALIVPLHLTPNQLAVVRTWLLQQEGKPYDWRAVAVFALPGQLRWTNPKAWFCSKMIMGLLEDALNVKIPKALPVTQISPRDVWMILVVAKLADYLRKP